MAERGASKNTIAAYKRDIEQFFKFTNEANERVVNRDDIKDFLHYLHEYKNTPKTQARKLSALREYFKFLYSENLRSDNPADNIDAPKLNKSLPKYLNEDEITKLINTINTMDRANKVRMVALLELAYGAGLRVSEMVMIPLNAVNLKNPIITVKGKGSKERSIPINLNTINALREYLLVRDIYLKGGRESMWLFPSSSKAGHLTRDGFYKMLKEIAVCAGINPKKVSPHVLRHSFASHLIAHDANLLSVQKMLGHSDVKTTEIYTHIMDDRLKNIVSNSHPLAKLKNI